ncbi:phage capsid protein [Dactylosporangium salmoneum]|uniref:Phage portal protein n=1 Tax=Dactylosporangium salmoneum TaxID=53361 RepID=A0ABP5SBI4_9ACTN
MALPANGTEWPPKAYKPAYDAYRVWDAWYSNDTDRLRSVYAGSGIRPDVVARARPSQYAGGIIGKASRWLWGRPSPLNGPDTRLHIPLASDIARASADMLFSEPPTLAEDDVPDDVRKRYEQLLEEDSWHQLLLDGAELDTALGDIYFRSVIDEDIAPGRAIPALVHADAAIPTIRYGHLIAVRFFRCLLEDGDTYLRLVEDHTDGRIDYALYEGRRDNLGQKVPLTEHPDAAVLIPGLDEGSGQETGVKGLTVERIPNLGPNRRWRGKPQLEQLGRPDIDGVEPGLDALDEAWTSWMRDLRLGKARIIADRNMLESNGPGGGAYLDLDREVWAPVNVPPSQNNSAPITLNQFAIRFAEHGATCDALTAWVLRSAGYSTQTFGEADQVAATATEVEQRERRSFTTRNRKIINWKPGLARFLFKHLMLEQAHFGGPAPVRLKLEFGDSVTESPLDVAQTVSLLAGAKAASKEVLVRMVHPDWDNGQVKAEVQALKDEEQVADPTLMGGADFAPPGNDRPGPPGPPAKGQPPGR